MIVSVDFLSVEQMRAVKPRHDIVVVSILDQSERHLRPRLAGFGGALTLTFEDNYERDGDAWSDEMDLDACAAVAVEHGERPPQLSDALAIDAFVMKHHADPRPLKLIAHCRAGISRSAAVALCYSRRLAAPIAEPTMRDTSDANPRLLRLLERAAGRWISRDVDHENEPRSHRP